MNIYERNRQIVNDIVTKEKEEYNIDFDVEVPTVVEYFIDNIEKGSFNLLKKSRQDIIITTLAGVRNLGYASGTKSVVIMNRDRSFNMFCQLPVADVKKDIPLNDVEIVMTTYHEIAHILQHRDLVTPYIDFCCTKLSSYEGLKGHVDRSFHDSLYSELHANLYGAVKAKEYFKGNIDAEEYIDDYLTDYSLKINLYDFDNKFEEYQEALEDKASLDADFKFEKSIWNSDGTFKRPREMLEDKKLGEYFDHSGFDELYTRIIASPTYLSRIDISTLDMEEREFLNEAIINNEFLIERNRLFLGNVFNKEDISKDEFESSIKMLDERISKVEDYRKQIIKNTDLEKEDRKHFYFEIDGNTIDSSKLLETMLEKEDRKKVASISTASDKLKSIIDALKEIPVSYAITMAQICAIAFLVPISVPAALATAGSLFTIPFLAPKFHYHDLESDSKGKNKV